MTWAKAFQLSPGTRVQHVLGPAQVITWNDPWWAAHGLHHDLNMIPLLFDNPSCLNMPDREGHWRASPARIQHVIAPPLPPLNMRIEDDL